MQLPVHIHGFSAEALTLLALPFLSLLDGSDDEPEGEEHLESSQISWLRSLGDRQALFQLMDRDRQLTQGLDAAEALAELGDVRGLDHLIATLKSPSSYLRHQAAEILEQLNHPRGLRALADYQKDPGAIAGSPALQIGASKRSTRREKLYEDLNARRTDDLVAIWHEDDRSQLSDLAFEVLETILIERLGQLPPRDALSESQPSDEIDEDVDPRVQELWLQGDIDGLIQLFESESDVSIQLGAAEAMAALGDKDALNLLIESLDDADPRVNELAASILDWLDLPLGKSALRERGYEVETGPADMLEAPAARSSPPASVASPMRDAWPVGRQMPPVSRAPEPSISEQAAAQPVWQQSEIAAPLSPAILLAGSVGGLLGFMAFRLGLHVFGLLPLPQDLAGWLQPSTLYLLPGSILVGAAFGFLGSRVAWSLTRRGASDAGEGDLAPVLGALIEGATSAVVADVLLFLVLKF